MDKFTLYVKREFHFVKFVPYGIPLQGKMVELCTSYTAMMLMMTMAGFGTEALPNFPNEKPVLAVMWMLCEVQATSRRVYLLRAEQYARKGIKQFN